MSSGCRRASGEERRLSFAAHLWTVGRRAADRLRPPPAPVSRPWKLTVSDRRRGTVRLTGRLSGGAAGPLVVVVHGLGGCAESHYGARAAAAAERLGVACLRLNLRGADGAGEDFYHAGLSSDLAAVSASPELAGHDPLVCLGFSLGGHLALRFATESADHRLGAVAAVCSPLDLAACVAAFDRPARWLYRGYVLRRLKRLYRPVAERHPEPVPLDRVLAARRIREWDELTVVPRWGFADAEEYYRSMSVGPRLERLRVPALLVAARHDPFVPAGAIRPFLDPPPPQLRVVWRRRAGHVAFPGGLDLGQDGPRGVEGQAISWLLEQAGSAAGRCAAPDAGRAAQGGAG